LSSHFKHAVIKKDFAVCEEFFNVHNKGKNRFIQANRQGMGKTGKQSQLNETKQYELSI
jgi:hypothetical protein